MVSNKLHFFSKINRTFFGFSIVKAHELEMRLVHVTDEPLMQLKQVVLRQT